MTPAIHNQALRRRQKSAMKRPRFKLHAEMTP